MAPQAAQRRVLSMVSALLLSGGIAPVDAADYLAMSGEQLYKRFCASCHGIEGHGDGPVSQSFAREIPDLTLIARRHGGEFQRDWVEKAIDGRQKIASHGAYTMPVWGEDFSQVGDPDAERATRTMISRLVDYLESLQRK